MADFAEPAQAQGDVFLDARGNGRAMRLSWHPADDVVVLSLWRDQMCAGTFRMPEADVGPFIDALIDGLRDAPGVHLPPPDAQRNADTLRFDDGSPGGLQAAETGAVVAPAFADWAFGADAV